MLAILASVVLGLGAVAADGTPAQPLRPQMLDAPAQALEAGQQLLNDAALPPLARQALLQDMATAAMQLSSEASHQIAEQLTTLGNTAQLSSALALADLIRAQVLLERDEIKPGLDLASAATASLRQLNTPYWNALADTELCDALLTAGRAGPARPYCERAYAAWPPLQREYERARSENLLQWAYGEQGRLAEALVLAQAARTRLQRLGTRGGVAMMDDNIAGLHLRLGQPEIALSASRRALAFELETGKTVHSISSRQNIAKALSALGQQTAALTELDAALADARRLQLGRISAELLDARATIAQQAGHLDQALAATRELIALNANLSSKEVERAVAELDAHYGAQVRETEIRDLKREGELQTAQLRAAEAASANEQSRARLYSLALVAALSVGGLLAAIIALRLRWLGQLNAALNQINRTRADMLAMAAHEIRNPLAAISGLIDMALHRITDRNARGLLETARATSTELVRTAEDYLDHAQLALDRIDLRYEPFHLPQLLNNVAQLFQAELNERPIVLSLHADPGLPNWVAGDAARLQQVLINLLGNAVKFTQHGEIRFHASIHSTAAVRFSVHDSGPGIAAHEIERLLQPFERGHERQRDGTGLGLSIANQLIQKLGGKLDIDSRPGIGSRFEFVLPLPAVAAPELAATATPTGHGRVLLVDDDSAIRELLSAQLDALGIEHRVAADVTEGFTTWREFAPQTLLIDLHLHGENGIDLIRRIRADCGLRRMPRCLIHSASPPYGPDDYPPGEWAIEWVRKPLPLKDLGRLLGGSPEARPVAPTSAAAVATASA